MNLSNRERALLVLDQWVCWSRSESENANEWTDCQNELMCYHIKYYVQTKSHEKEKKINRAKNMQKLMTKMIPTQKQMLMEDSVSHERNFL